MKEKSKNRKKRMWIIIVAVALILVVITFTPLILSPGRINPKFLSLPYTLWTSMLITVILVILTYVGSRMRNND